VALELLLVVFSIDVGVVTAGADVECDCAWELLLLLATVVGLLAVELEADDDVDATVVVLTLVEFEALEWDVVRLEVIDGASFVLGAETDAVLLAVELRDATEDVTW